MRLARRLWLKAVMDEDENTLRDLYPLFSSPMAALSQIRAESKTVRSVMIRVLTRSLNI